MSTDVVPRATVEDRCRWRDQALAKYLESARLFAEARELHQIAAPAGISTFNFSEMIRKTRDCDDIVDALRPVIDRDMWQALIPASPLWSLMDKEERDRFEHSLKTAAPPFTVEVVMATITRLTGESDMIFKRGLVKAFEQLCRQYRSNNGFALGDRIVLEHVTDASWNRMGYSFSLSHYTEEKLRDVDRIMHVLDGKPAPDYQQGLCAAIRAQMAKGKEITETETPYWRVRWYKNGNGHLWPLRKDLLERANRMIAEHFGLALGSDRQGRRAADDAPPRHADDFGDFPTPGDIADGLIFQAGIQRGMRVLEPSAGAGRLAARVVAKEALVDCYEVQPRRVAELTDNLRAIFNGPWEPVVRVFAADFLTAPPLPEYDRVVMNPPFAPRGTDIRHVLHAWEFLKPGGRLVAIMSAGALSDSGRLGQEFSQWRARVGPSVEWLAPGAFAESGTNVRTVLLVADKAS